MNRTPVGLTGSFIFEVGAVDKVVEPKKRTYYKKSTIEFERFVVYVLVTSIQCCLFWVTHPNTYSRKKILELLRDFKLRFFMLYLSYERDSQCDGELKSQIFYWSTRVDLLVNTCGL